MKLPASPAYAVGDVVVCLTNSGYRLFDCETFTNFARSIKGIDTFYVPAVTHGIGREEDFHKSHRILMQYLDDPKSLPRKYDLLDVLKDKGINTSNPFHYLNFAKSSLTGALMLLNEIEMRYDIRWQDEFANTVEVRKMQEYGLYEEDEEFDEEAPVTIKKGLIVLHKKTSALAKKMGKPSNIEQDKKSFRETEIINVHLTEKQLLILTTKKSNYLMHSESRRIEEKFN